jgi:hypothetical protein
VTEHSEYSTGSWQRVQGGDTPFGGIAAGLYI